jgi:RimJ/RimL family protein N-acetyltransferase
MRFQEEIVTMYRNDIINYKVTEHLRDQRKIMIRAVCPDDKELVMKVLPRLSDDSLYRRLFMVKRDFSDNDLKEITEVDFFNVVASFAEMELDGEALIVAGGRYIRSGVFGTRQRAEVAFIVGEPVQRYGIASRIFKHLSVIARASGIAEFEAEVLPYNNAAFKVFDKSGYPVKKSVTRESVHVLIDLTGGEASP